ncbi:MAG TPA: helix-turn-helix domain-containing protein [Pseudonocardiaceae bacterium]|nr:helix-turn-helix domain-containing protein [Pseudonocardiaceae bacterium]
MRALRQRMADLDKASADAVRIIEFFDALTGNRAGFEALARATAGLAECPAGIRDNAGTVLAHFDSDGRPVVDEPPAGRVDRPYGTTRAGGVVWLDRRDAAHPLDEMILERMAVSAAIILDRHRGVDAGLRDDPVLVRTLLNPRATEDVKRAAAQALGLAGHVIVLAAHLAAGQPERLTRLAHLVARDLARQVRAVPMDEPTVALVVDAVDLDDLERAVTGRVADRDRVGIGCVRPAARAHLSWRRAGQALRFAEAGCRGTVVRCDGLGPQALLASLPPADLADDDDVRALHRLAGSRGGAEVITTLQHLVQRGSVRQVSADLHMHHSSIAHRLDRARAALGYPLDGPQALFRLRLALEMWRLAGAELTADDARLAD